MHEWLQQLAESERRLGDDAQAAEAEIQQQKEQFARAATAMMTRLRDLFEAATLAFNGTAPQEPVAMTHLKGAGFAVSRGTQRLAVLKSADWNIVFTFSNPPQVDLLTLLSWLDGEVVRWRVYHKPDDKDKFEAAPPEPGDIAEIVSKRLFGRLVQRSGPRAYRIRK
jgi:hypothetical protein